jgi:hypothetical protein
MANDKITINRGDTYSRTINLKDSAGSFIDATDWLLYFTVRKNITANSSNADADAVISKTISGSGTGIHTMVISSTQTNISPGNYFYDIQIKKSDNTIISSSASSFVVNGDVTRAA